MNLNPKSSDNHLESDKHEHRRESVFEVMKRRHEATESKIERPESEDREDIGSIDDEHIIGDSENRRNRIDCEDEIGEFYHDQCHEKWRHEQFTINPRKKIPIVICLRYRQDFFQKNHNRLLFEIDFFFTLEQHLDTTHDEESSENIHDIVEILHEFDTRKDENRSHEECSDNPPEEDLVLIHFLDMEV